MQTPPDFVQYPRAPRLASGIAPRPPGVYFDAFSEGWALFAREWTTWVAAELLAGIVYFAVYVPFFFVMNRVEYGASAGWLPPPGAVPSASGVMLGWLVTLIPALIVAGIQAGFCSMAIRQVRGQPISVGQVFGSFRFAPKVFLIGFCVSLPGTVCFALMGLPGAFVEFGLYALLYPLFALAPYIMVDQPVSGFRAMGMSAKALGGFLGWVAMLLLLIAIGLLSFAGALACLVGALAAVPLGITTLAVHYYYYFPSQFELTEPAYGQP